MQFYVPKSPTTSTYIVYSNVFTRRKQTKRSLVFAMICAFLCHTLMELVEARSPYVATTMTPVPSVRQRSPSQGSAAGSGEHVCARWQDKRAQLRAALS